MFTGILLPFNAFGCLCAVICKFFGPVPHSLGGRHSIVYDPPEIPVIGLERKPTASRYCITLSMVVNSVTIA